MQIRSSKKLHPFIVVAAVIEISIRFLLFSIIFTTIIITNTAESFSLLSVPTITTTTTAAATTAKTTATTTTTTTTSTRTPMMSSKNNHLHHTNIPLPKLTSFANSFAAVHGLQVETKKQSQQDSSSSKSSSSSYQCAPISLLPNIFPRQCFEQAQTVAPLFNVLVDKISRNGKFLNETLAGGDDDNNGHDGKSSVIAKDEYTKKLLELYNDIYHRRTNDKKPNFAHLADRLGIQRSDYMLHPSTSTTTSSSSSFELKQVELNTIAASFGGLATNVAKLHSILTNRFHSDLKDFMDSNQKKVMGGGEEEEDSSPTSRDDNDIIKGVPYNHALEKLPLAMKLAHERYKERFVVGSGNSSSSGKDVPSITTPLAILFVVQEGETNTVDQRMLEFELYQKHTIPVVRMSLTKAHTHLQLDSDTGSLYVLNDDDVSSIDYEISLVYFRAGYAPTDYPDGYNGIEWSSREIIERSRSTKCPNLGYHLAGTKKVQQEIARPGVLEKLYGEKDMDDEIQRMRDAFAGLYSLGNDAVQEDYDAVQDVLSGAEGKYVLKPQREGGGYNFYGESLALKIKENVEVNSETGELTLGEDLAEFILMQRLFPPKQTAVLLRAGVVEGCGESISELGCFGTILQSYDGETTLHNEYAGFLLRTKFENVDEGGVASGFATLSSPYLC